MSTLAIVSENSIFTQCDVRDNISISSDDSKSSSSISSGSNEKKISEVSPMVTDVSDRILEEPVSKLSTYRVLSWNILFPSHQKHAKKCLPNWDVRVHQIFNNILAANADVGCLQEVQLPYYERLEAMLVKAGYTPIFDRWKYPHKETENKNPEKSKQPAKNKPYRLGKEGCVIFYKRDKFKEISRHSVSLKDATGRRLQVVNLAPKDGSGSAFHVFNAHLMWIHSKALHEVRVILNEIAKIKGPQVFCGDFNSPSDDEVLAEVGKAGFVDVLNVKGVQQATYIADHKGQNHGKVGQGVRTDYICTKGHEEAGAASIFGSFEDIRTAREPSDHLMVLADLALPKSDLQKDASLEEVLKLFSADEIAEIVQLSSGLSQSLQTRLYEFTYLLEKKKGVRIDVDPLEFGRCAYLKKGGADVSSPSIRKDAFQLLMLEKVLIPLLERSEIDKARQLFSLFNAKIQDQVFTFVYQIEKKAKRHKDEPKFGAQAFLSDKYKTSNKTRIKAIQSVIEKRAGLFVSKNGSTEIVDMEVHADLLVPDPDKTMPSQMGQVFSNSDLQVGMEVHADLLKPGPDKTMSSQMGRAFSKSDPQKDASLVGTLRLFSADDIAEIAQLSSGLSQSLQTRLYEFTYLLEKKKGVRIDVDPLEFGRCAYVKEGGVDVSSPSIRKDAFQLLMLEKVVIPLLEQSELDKALQLFSLFDAKIQGKIFKFVYQIERKTSRYKHHASFGEMAFLGGTFNTPNKTRIKAIRSIIANKTV